MARNETLSCLEKRDLLNQPAVSLETLTHWGQIFEEAGSVFDSLDFYAKANDSQALERLMKHAVGQGDVFLFKQVCRALKHEPGREEWLEIAKNAERTGNHALAAQAYRAGGEEEMAERHSPSGSA